MNEARIVKGKVIAPDGTIVCDAPGCNEYAVDVELVKEIRSLAEDDEVLAATLKPIDLKHAQRIVKEGFADIVNAASGIEQLELAAVVKSQEEGITHEQAMSEILKTEKGRKAWAEWESKR
jgi:hypothetical protein